MARAVVLSGALILLALAGISATEQWPQFRGPQAGVIADDPALPDTWSETENVVWKTSIPGFGWSSPVVYYYTLLDRGFLLCHDAKTGQQIYGRQRIAPDSSGFTASPWAYNGKIFVLSEDGDTFVIQAGRAFKVLGKNSLNEMTLATPAVVRGSLIVRTQSKLYRIAKAAR